MKRCTKCGNKHPATLKYFRSEKRHKDGLRPHCRECDREYSRKYYQSHKIERLKYVKAYEQTLIGYLRHRFRIMKNRCDRPKNSNYKYYGGRGIKCKFKNANEFVDYVLIKLKVDPHGLQIDRIDNNGHYEKGNIRFVTAKVNANNRRKPKCEN